MNHKETIASPTRLTMLKYRDACHSRRDGRAPNSIIATCRISFEHIRRVVPTAAWLLSLMSLFDRQGIPQQLLQDGEANFDDDIQTLTNYSLVEMSVDGREFEMHRLVQFTKKKRLELKNELDQWKKVYAMFI